MGKVEPSGFPSLHQYLQQEREGVRRLSEEGWHAALHNQAIVMLSAEQAENLLLVSPGAIRNDIVDTIRLQLDALRSAS